MPRARSSEIDTSPFDRLLAEALRAYGLDDAYAVAMSRTAVTVQNKRRVWQARIELRTAERVARERCSSSDARVCGVSDPCGTGSCPFANGELALLHAEARVGRSRRPIPSFADGYTIESAVRPLLANRGVAV